MKALSKLRQLAAKQNEKAILATIALLTSQSASAAGFSLPGFADLGCKVISWMTGELSIMIFFIVVIVTLLVGFFAKMDWTKILGVIVLFGLLQGATSLFSGYITTSISCLAGSL